MLCAQLHSGKEPKFRSAKHTLTGAFFSLAATDVTPDQDPAGGSHPSPPPGAAGSRGMLSALTHVVQNTVSPWLLPVFPSGSLVLISPSRDPDT